MRLRSIELTNVRRFAGKRALLSGMGDGITVLSEPNEFGKSTFFDALHALFFEKHNSRNAEIKALQPHSGGGPEVAVEVDLSEGRFRISKRWLARPQAQVTDGAGRLIAQADEAEAWIDRLMGGGLAGPSGLLWVRQGLLGLEPEGNTTEEKRARENGLVARRDLLSSVAGEIDMMTGGRRMDAVLDRVTEALSKLATNTGRAKAGGEWARAIDEATALGTEESTLRQRAERLSGDLARRAEVLRSLSRLTDPAEAADRTNALADAEAALATARLHQAEVAQAEATLRQAKMDDEVAQRDITAIETLLLRLDEARAEVARTEETVQKARTRADELHAQERVASEKSETDSLNTLALRARLALANKAQAAHQARAGAAQLQKQLDRATDIETTLNQARALRSRLTVTRKSFEAAEAAQVALDLVRARAEAIAVTVEALPDGPSIAMIGDRPLPAGPQPLMSAADILLPGFGRLRVDPARGHDDDMASTVMLAETELNRLLAELQVSSLSAARAVWAEAQRLDAEIQQETALLTEVAPQGLGPLRSALAQALVEAEGAPEEVEDAAELTEAVRRAEIEEQESRAAARTAQALASEASEARAVAEANRSSSVRQLEATLTEAGDTELLIGKVAELKASRPKLAQDRKAAEETLSALRASAPDPATIEARLSRARGAVDQAAREEARAREELASLNATISARAEEGIEERLSAVTEARVEADGRAARYDLEVKALTRLKRALDEARTKARDAYFGPVLRELQPLLSIVSPGAQLTIDDTTLLPVALTRNGQEESLDILSGGTREQVAILTRLAFARLFAASGRPVPVILDDALVHSDDDRIEAMFDALHRSAQDQQILVLTCRQRAFAALGGEKAVVQIDAA